MNSPHKKLSAEYEPPRNVTIRMTEHDAAIHLRRHELYHTLREAHTLVRATWKHGSEMRLEQLYSLLCEACAVFEEENNSAFRVPTDDPMSFFGCIADEDEDEN